MMRWVVALLVLFGWRRGHRERRARERERLLPPGEPSPRGAEAAAVVLLLLAAACGVAFLVLFAAGSVSGRTQLLGLALGLAFAFLAAALVVIGKGLVVTEHNEEDYPQAGRPEEQEAIVQLVEESGERLTRKRMLRVAGGAAGGAIGAALVAPALSLGPFFKTDPLYATPWRRGRRLVTEEGRPFSADEIEEGAFYTAFPEGAAQDKVASPLVLVRLSPRSLALPAGRQGWAPEGIVAYSKVCTHAGCAVALYRKPTFAPVQPRPALVCPCHYSTFDPARGAEVIFGPAGRPLPQLPLLIDRRRQLRAAGNFSGPVGPGWWGVRMERPS